MLRLALIALLLQAAGDTREVTRSHDDLRQTTDVALRLIPDIPGGTRPLLRLTFYATYAGRTDRDAYTGLPQWPTGTPARITLTAEALPLVVAREFTIRLVIDGAEVDLTPPLGGSFRNVPCITATDNCVPSGVEAEITPAILHAMVQARVVQGQALGFPIALNAADQAALKRFETPGVAR